MHIPQDLIQQHINMPSTALAYSLAQRLKSFASPQYVLFSDDSSFNIDGFIRFGGCELIESEKDFVLENTTFEENRLLSKFWMGVLQIRWKETQFTVVQAKSYDDYDVYHYIIGPNRMQSERLFEAICRWSTGANDAVTVYQSGYFDRNTELFAKIQSSSMDRLYLTENLLNQLRSGVFDFLEQKEVYHQNSLPWKRGLIFHGPPGNGKSQVIQALIKETGLRSIYVRSLFDRWGDSESNIRDIFLRAKALAPCILVLEDVDSLINDRVRSPFLNAMDGVGSADGILTIATTNHLDSLDVAIRKRPSRFDQLIEFANPDMTTRYGYLLRQLRTTKGEKVEGIGEAARRTEGASFASLQELKRTFLTMRVRNPEDPQLLEKVLDQLEYPKNPKIRKVRKVQESQKAKKAEKSKKKKEKSKSKSD